jgi:hypothetical protein
MQLVIAGKAAKDLAAAAKAERDLSKELFILIEPIHCFYQV